MSGGVGSASGVPIASLPPIFWRFALDNDNNLNGLVDKEEAKAVLAASDEAELEARLMASEEVGNYTLLEAGEGVRVVEETGEEIPYALDLQAILVKEKVATPRPLPKDVPPPPLEFIRAWKNTPQCQETIWASCVVNVSCQGLEAALKWRDNTSNYYETSLEQDFTNRVLTGGTVAEGLGIWDYYNVHEALFFQSMDLVCELEKERDLFDLDSKVEKAYCIMDFDERVDALFNLAVEAMVLRDQDKAWEILSGIKEEDAPFLGSEGDNGVKQKLIRIGTIAAVLYAKSGEHKRSNEMLVWTFELANSFPERITRTCMPMDPTALSEYRKATPRKESWELPSQVCSHDFPRYNEAYKIMREELASVDADFFETVESAKEIFQTILTPPAN